MGYLVKKDKTNKWRNKWIKKDKTKRGGNEWMNE